MPELLAELIGPYERWAHGTGARYAPATIEVSATHHIAAVADLPAGVDPTKVPSLDMSRDLAQDGRWAAYLPTLWQPAFQGPVDAEEESVFCPLVLRVSPDSDSQQPNRLADIGSCLDYVTSLLNADYVPLSGTGMPGDRKASTSARFGYRLNTPVPTASLNRSFTPEAIKGRCPERRPDEREPAAILAVIDDGIPFAHRNLRDKNNRSRVEFCWLQGAQSDPERPETHSVLFGREHTRDDIDRFIETFGHDEDALYSKSSNERIAYPGATINRFGTHGSHILDMAAGHRHGSMPTPMRPVGADGDLDALRVIAVQLPIPVTLDTAGFGKDAFILSAFHYIFHRADLIAERFGGKPIPLIINFSYGFSGGPHNGRDRLERALHALIRKRGGDTCLVMPAGNEFLSKLFGTITPALLESRGSADGNAFDIRWRIQPNDHTSNYLEIWLPDGATPDGISVEIHDPVGRRLYEKTLSSTSGEEPGSPGQMAGHEQITISGRPGDQAIGQFSVEPYRTGRERSLWRLFVALAPTEPDNALLPATRPGVWTVKLANIRSVMANGPMSCRIQRDNNPFGYAQGARQSYFDDAFDESFDPTGQWATGDNPERAFVRRFGTLNGLATHDLVTVVGAFVESSKGPHPARYSSAGTTGGSFAPGTVHCSARSETSYAVPGVTAAGTRSGAVFHLSGTSTAAPQIARQLAVAYMTKGSSRSEVAVSGAAHLVQSLGRPVGENESRVRLGERLLLSSESAALPLSRRAAKTDAMLEGESSNTPVSSQQDAVGAG
jgi:hypothetical protein